MKFFWLYRWLPKLKTALFRWGFVQFNGTRFWGVWKPLQWGTIHKSKTERLEIDSDWFLPLMNEFLNERTSESSTLWTLRGSSVTHYTLCQSGVAGETPAPRMRGFCDGWWQLWRRFLYIEITRHNRHCRHCGTAKSFAHSLWIHWHLSDFWLGYAGKTKKPRTQYKTRLMSLVRTMYAGVEVSAYLPTKSLFNFQGTS